MEPTIVTNPTGPQQLDFLEALNFSISENLSLKEQLATERDRLDAELLQNSEYAQLIDSQKGLTEKKKQVKKALLANESIAAEINDTVKELRKQLKEAKKTMGEYAVNYFKQSGKTELRTNEGVTAKLRVTIKV